MDRGRKAQRPRTGTGLVNRRRPNQAHRLAGPVRVQTSDKRWPPACGCDPPFFCGAPPS